MDEPKKKKRGIKAFEFTPEILAKIEDMASKGLTQEQIARCIGIAPETLSRKKSINTQLCQAIKTGQAKGLAVITNSLFNRAKDGDTTATIFYLCNRDRDNWKHVSKAGDKAEDTDKRLADLLQNFFTKAPN